jgi:hypothetical protein
VLVLTIVMVMVVVVPVVVVVIVAGGVALTGRGRRNSTTGLTGVSAAVLALADLCPRIGQRHAQLGAEGRVVAGPVGGEGSEARFWGGI